MLATLLLIAVTLSSSEDSGLLDARRAATDVLRPTLADLEKTEDEPARASRLIAAGTDAARVLGASVLGGELDEIVYEARWREAVERGSAASRLEDDLRRVLGDLEFEPIVEADLPEGFPEPTPVGEIELKRFPVYRIARAGEGGNGAFWQLFQHIKKHDIPMTAPVEMTYDATGDEVDMAFMYEHAEQGDVGPDGSVDVTDVEPMLVVSLGCRGWSSESALADAYVKLATWIHDRGDLEIAGATRRFGYNGPSVRGDQRYFEVQIPVRELIEESPTEVASDFAAASGR